MGATLIAGSRTGVSGSEEAPARVEVLRWVRSAARVALGGFLLVGVAVWVVAGRTAARVEAVFEQQDRLLRAVTHELRTPLGWLQAVVERGPPARSPRRRRWPRRGYGQGEPGTRCLSVYSHGRCWPRHTGWVIVQLVLVGLLGAVAVGVATVIRRRGADAPEKGAAWAVPVQLDRADFTRPEAEWLVVVFSSATCLACQGTWDKAQHLESDAVAVQEVEAIADKALHERYEVDAVPLVVVADAAGAVRRSFVGPPTATDLWAALAELREPGSVPPSCTG